ncbi:sensor histidine kinase [Polaribacter sp. MSW13]|uniref:Sensor histidine kinase n=1 Tax=Polaribacter marinus TaxID=2916838 RepID=A0A9X2ANB3_9FLAO|nr:tetratricopeptide repeat protein [Polaribacter marinus]MCI2229724.1 sensor histidine kinase [Polaribacter marinus]
MKLKQKQLLRILFFCLFLNSLNNYAQDVNALNKEAMDLYKTNQKEAIKVLTNALEIAERHNNKKEVSKTKNNLGIVFRDLGEFQKAKKYSEDALTVTTDSLIKAAIYNNIGACNRKLGLYEDAISNYLKSLEIYEAKKMLNETATVHNNIAIVYNYINLNKKSLEYYDKAIKVFEKLNNNKGISQAYNNIAIVYANEGDLEKALTNFRYSLSLEKKLKDKKGIAESLNNVGSVHYYLKAIDSSIYYFKKSADIERSIGNFAGVSASYNNIAQVLLEIERFKESKTYIDSAYRIAKKYQTSEDIENALLNYTDYFEKKGNYKSSLNHHKKYLHFKDSIAKKTNIKTIQEIETKYQTEKKEKEIAIQKEQLLEKELAIKNRNLYAILITSALLILGIIFFNIYKRNQIKRKQLQKEIDLKDALAIIKTQNKLQEQRLRISRDLHDNIGSQLTFIISSIDNLKFITKDANTKLKDKLANISSFTSETIHQLRDTIWAMNKNEISMEDLHARILSFIEKAKSATENITFEIHQKIDTNVSLSTIKGINIFRVIQEAINNAIKYANASKVEIYISKENNELQILITDNGDGFDLKNVDLGNGLSNMEKRMSEIDGEINIVSKLKKGTKITLSTTLKDTANGV